MAPLSPPSDTDKPIANPARIILSNLTRDLPEKLLCTAASARNMAARERARLGKPQQALEKKLPFSAAAKPVNIHTAVRKPNVRQNNAALSPRMSSDTGTQNLLKPMGPKTTSIMPVKFGVKFPPKLPSQFRSFHMPKNALGIL